MPGPLTAIRSGDGGQWLGDGGQWLGEGGWVDGSRTLRVGEAWTEILERGPVRARVRQTLRLTDGRQYTMLVELGCEQDAVLVTEDSTIHAPQAAFTIDLTPTTGPPPPHGLASGNPNMTNSIRLPKGFCSVKWPLPAAMKTVGFGWPW